ncbi:MAG: DsbA family protein, partial [Actinomycetota bacterium]|nr:DsbA family protein [Actinomycetota bacterium]
MTTPTRPDTLDFHFDVLCPWAYQTSLWMRDVRSRTNICHNWRFFSLEEINRVEGKRHPWEREWSFGWSILRIGALLGRIDAKHLDDWYAVTGRALHVDGMKIHEPEVARHLVEEIGLDPGLVDEAIRDSSTHDEVRADHDKVVAAGGFGVPTLFFPGVGGGPEQTIFGPVLIDPPTGDAALRLWDVVCGWLEFPHLYELQRPKTKEDERLIGRTFKPYMEARDWVSINRGKVVAMEEDGFKVKGDAENAGQLKS